MKTPREIAESLAKDLNLDNRDGAVDEIERIFEVTEAKLQAKLEAARAEGRLEGAEAMRADHANWCPIIIARNALAVDVDKVTLTLNLAEGEGTP